MNTQSPDAAISRRQALRALGATGLVALWPSHTRALGVDAKVGVGLLRHGTGHEQRPDAVEQLMWETSKRTSIDVRERPITLDPLDEALFRWPLVAWIGTGPCPPLPDAAVRRLSRFLRAGGTLFIDDASPIGDDRFDAGVRRDIARIWPDRPLSITSNDHTVYRTFFLLERPSGRVDRVNHLETVDFDDRSPLIYGRNDLFGAFGRNNLGVWHLPVTPGGSTQRELAFRMGINLVMYATCLNYKRDQVHTTAILRRRRWRVDAPSRRAP